MAVFSTWCIGWSEAFESEDSFATWSVMSGEVSSNDERHGVRRHTAGGVLFLVVVRHDGWFGCLWYSLSCRELFTFGRVV